MRKWVARQLWVDSPRSVVVLDPDGVVSEADLIGVFENSAAIHTVRDWFELRRAWEINGRHRQPTDPRLAVIVQDPTVLAATDLPFDIEQGSTVRRVRVPGPPETASAIQVLDDETSDRAVDQLEASGLAPADAVLTAIAGAPALVLSGSGARQFQVALRLISQPQPDEVMELARSVITDPLALALLGSTPDMDAVHEAWQDWIDDPETSAFSMHMTECRSELVDLFMSGRMSRASAGDREVPRWATVGIVEESPADRVAALLDSPPSAQQTSLDDWVHVAQWWGDVRSGLAKVNPSDPPMDERAWSWWADADERFLAWLRASYGSQLTRAWSSWPVSLDKVQPYLAKRQTVAGRVLLVVLDGMGFTQWTRIRELSELRVIQSGGVLAMLPTLTEVSRQAIAAGTVPTQFADSLRSTSKEPKRWATAWEESGSTTAWLRVDGARTEELDGVPFGTADVIGLVLSATDKLMHSAELLGDTGLHASLEAWVRSGVLAAVLERAAEHGYETWLTADHGNLAVVPAKEPREGAFVERAGTRARRYASKTLRDDAAVDGVIWDALPGYPAHESERLLFAPGRAGWGHTKLSHGGLSLDEVIVPLVHVEPAS